MNLPTLGRFVIPEVVATHFLLHEGDKVADFGAGSGFASDHLDVPEFPPNHQLASVTPPSAAALMDSSSAHHPIPIDHQKDIAAAIVRIFNTSTLVPIGQCLVSSLQESEICSWSTLAELIDLRQDGKARRQALNDQPELPAIADALGKIVTEGTTNEIAIKLRLRALDQLLRHAYNVTHGTLTSPKPTKEPTTEQFAQWLVNLSKKPDEGNAPEDWIDRYVDLSDPKQPKLRDVLEFKSDDQHLSLIHI